MRTFASSCFLALSIGAAGPAFAQAAPATTPAITTQPAPVMSQDARDAVELVDAFAAVLAAGQLDVARQFLTPDAVIVANGKTLGTRDAYIDGPARGDAAALRTVDRDILHRNAWAGPGLAYVVTEKRLRAPGATTGPSEVVIETMLVRKTESGWKIAHVHWSGRHAS